MECHTAAKQKYMDSYLKIWMCFVFGQTLITPQCDSGVPARSSTVATTQHAFVHGPGECKTNLSRKRPPPCPPPHGICGNCCKHRRRIQHILCQWDLFPRSTVPYQSYTTQLSSLPMSLNTELPSLSKIGSRAAKQTPENN